MEESTQSKKNWRHNLRIILKGIREVRTSLARLLLSITKALSFLFVILRAIKENLITIWKNRMCFPRSIKFKELKVVLVCWIEMPSSSFANRLKPLILKKGNTALYESNKGGMKVTIIPYGVGLRLFCDISVKEGDFSIKHTKKIFEDMENFGVQSIKDFFSRILPQIPVWVYVYPNYYVLELRPKYRRIKELDNLITKAIDEFLDIDYRKLEKMYPPDVITPELAIEALPTLGIFDPYVNREVAFTIAKGLTIGIGVSKELAKKFNQAILDRIEPRAYVSFRDIIPRKAKKISEFPFFYRVQLTSGKGWIDNMLILEDALNKYATLSEFKAMEENVKENIVFAMAGIMVGLCFALSTKSNIFFLVFGILFMINSCVFMISKVLYDKIPFISGKMLVVAKFLFYSLFVGFVLITLHELF